VPKPAWGVGQLNNNLSLGRLGSDRMRNVGGFCLLEISPEEFKRRRISFALGFAVETAGIGLLALAGLWFPYQISQGVNRYVLINLPSPAEQMPILKPPPLPKAVARKIEPPKPLAPPVDAPGIEIPEIHAKLPVPNVSKQPQSMAAIAQPSPPPSQPPRTVHAGLFGQVEGYSVSERTPLKQVQTGGFGDPEGLPGRAQAGNPGNVPKLGAFDLLAGPGRGNGIGGSQGSPRTVASTGFGGGGVGIGLSRGPEGGAPAAVKTGVFGVAPESTQAPVKPLRAAPPAPEIQPVEILFKPSPQYTEEARRLRVEGEVVLSVVFQANGTLRVVDVVKSLGHGLDQMAEQAASQMRFKPAEQAGKPTDFPATLRIEFRLA